MFRAEDESNLHIKGPLNKPLSHCCPSLHTAYGKFLNDFHAF